MNNDKVSAKGGNPKPAGKKSEPKTPTDLRKALAAAPLVEAVWKSLTPLARWDFIIWIEAAKQPETRRHRIEKACDMLTAGKRRPCCFTIVPTDLYKALEANPKAKAQWKDLGPAARRDFVSWIDSAKQPELSKKPRRASLRVACGRPPQLAGFCPKAGKATHLIC